MISNIVVAFGSNVEFKSLNLDQLVDEEASKDP
jgi:hypothetical protein